MLRNILLFMLFAVLVFGQSAQMMTHIHISDVHESSISAANHISDVSGAHITTSLTLPDNYKTDSSPLPLVPKLICSVGFTMYQPNDSPYRTESDGFIGIKKYQSSYLPSYL